VNAEIAMADRSMPTGLRAAVVRAWSGRTKYLIAAICIALCTIMLFPLVVSVLASVKTSIEASAVPPTYYPHAFSLENYQRLATYEAGLLSYLGNSALAALLTIIFCLALTIPAGYALAKMPVPGKEFIFVLLLLALIIPYQALITPIFFMFVQLRLTNSIVGLAIIHTAIQIPFSLYIIRNSFEAVPRDLEEAAVIDGCNSWQVLTRICLPAIRPAVVTVSLFAFITSWNEFLGAMVIMSKDTSFTLPVMLSTARTATSLGGTDWGMLQAGVVISMVPCLLVFLFLQKYYVSGLLSGAVK
jgi:multiple sugar transport system permease protein